MKRFGITSGLLIVLLLTSFYSWGSSASQDNPWLYLIDTQGTLSLESVRQRALYFQPVEQAEFATAPRNQVLWLRTSLNGLKTPAWLWLFSPRFQQMDYFRLNDGKLEAHFHQNTYQPRATLPLLSRALLLSMPYDGKPHEIYLRVSSDQPLMSWFRILDKDGLIQQERPALLSGIIIGLLLMSMLYNGIRRFYNQDASTLWLSLLSACLAISATASLGVSFLLYATPNHQQTLVADLGILASLLCLLKFCASFVRGYRNYYQGPLYLLYGMASLIIIQAALIFFDVLPYISVALTTSVIACCLVILLFISLYWRRGFYPVRLVMSSTLLLLVGTLVLATLRQLHGQINPGWISAGFYTLAAACGVLLSLAVTESRQYRQRRKLKHRTSQAAYSAELKSKADFLARINHQVRTPMDGILGPSELLLNSPLSSQQRSYVQTIHTSGNHLLSLINDILDITQLESGQLDLNDIPFDLKAMITECSDIFRIRGLQQQVVLLTTTQPELPQLINGDPARLRQMLLNLLDHAFNQVDDGKVLFNISLQQGQEQSLIVFTIRDNGLPLPRDIRTALLHAPLHSQDFLSDTGLSRHTRLMIVRQMAILMGGKLSIEAGKHRGSTLTLSLPVDSRHLQTKPPALDNLLHDRRLLVVTNTPVCSKLLISQGESWHMQVTAVLKGKRALALLRTKTHLGEHFDAILIDEDLPDIDSDKLVKRIQELYGASPLPLIILLSTNSGSRHVPDGVIHCTLSKPISGYILKTVLTHGLSQRPVGFVASEAS